MPANTVGCLFGPLLRTPLSHRLAAWSEQDLAGTNDTVSLLDAVGHHLGAFVAGLNHRPMNTAVKRLDRRFGGKVVGGQLRALDVYVRDDDFFDSIVAATHDTDLECRVGVGRNGSHIPSRVVAKRDTRYETC